jgi:MFS family permease
MRSANFAARRFDIPLAVAITLAVQVAISLLAAAPPVFAPEIARERGWNVTLIAFYPALLCISLFWVSFYVPRLLERLGGMGLSLACVVVSAVGLLALFAPTLSFVALVPLAIGFASGCMNPASAQVLGPRTSPQTAGLIMSIKQSGVPLGAMLAGVLVPILVLRAGWHRAVVELAAGAIVLTILVLPMVRWLNGPPVTKQAGPFQPFEPARQLAAMPGMLKLLFAGITFTAMQHCLRSFLTVYLVRNLRLSLEVAGLIYGVSQAAGIIGQIVWALISDRYFTAHAVMAAIGVLMTGAALLTAAFAPGWPLLAIMAVAAIYGLTAAGFVPVLLGELIRKAPPGQAGALTSGSQVFLTPAILVGPLLFGFVASVLDYPAAFVTLAACALAGAVVAATGGAAPRRMHNER